MITFHGELGAPISFCEAKYLLELFLFKGNRKHFRGLVVLIFPNQSIVDAEYLNEIRKFWKHSKDQATSMEHEAELMIQVDEKLGRKKKSPPRKKGRSREQNVASVTGW